MLGSVCGGREGQAHGVRERGSLTELSIPSARSMMKNTTAQNVDPDRVEMASGYRMKTRPAPERCTTGLVNGWDCGSEPQVAGGHLEAPSVTCGQEETKGLKMADEASSSARVSSAPRR